jgi:glucose-1-phosphate cytidylyltransferase
MSESIKIVILCGGVGTRLREETEFRPKPMVNIGSRPILWHIMKYYSQFGHNNFVLALGYKGEMIKHYFCHYELMNNDVTLELGHPENMCIHHLHDESGWKITLADTGEQTLKGARLKKVEKYITNDVFMMTYGDGIADVDINALLMFHKSHGKMVTVTGINPASRFGELKIDGERVVTFSEKPRDGEGLINGGFFVFNRRIFDYLTTADACDLEIGPLEQIAREGQLMVYKHRGFWACMDTLRDMEYLNRIWENGKAQWKIW